MEFSFFLVGYSSKHLILSSLKWEKHVHFDRNQFVHSTYRKLLVFGFSHPTDRNHRVQRRFFLLHVLFLHLFLLHQYKHQNHVFLWLVIKNQFATYFGWHIFLALLAHFLHRCCLVRSVHAIPSPTLLLIDLEIQLFQGNYVLCRYATEEKESLLDRKLFELI